MGDHMKLQELIDQLNELADEYEGDGISPDDVEVLVAVQPTYPLTHIVSNVVPGHVVGEGRDQFYPLSDEHKDALWIAVSQVNSLSSTSPYAPREVWEAQR